MTASHILLQREITVRGYEPDASRYLPPAFYLRFMEHLRWESLKEDASGMGQLFRDGRAMVVVLQQLELLQDVGLGTALIGSLWIARVGRTSLVFHHTFAQKDQRDSLVARAAVTAVYLDAQRRPMPLPDTVRDSARGKAPDQDFVMIELPRQEVPAHAWVQHFTVRPSELDFLQHVNHANYLVYCDDTRQLAAAAQGYGPQSAAAQARIRRVALEYKHQAVFGEQLALHTWALPDHPARFAFELQRQDQNEVLCRAVIQTLVPFHELLRIR